jgi:hypothetical protein
MAIVAFNHRAASSKRALISPKIESSVQNDGNACSASPRIQQASVLSPRKKANQVHKAGCTLDAEFRRIPQEPPSPVQYCGFMRARRYLPAKFAQNSSKIERFARSRPAEQETRPLKHGIPCQLSQVLLGRASPSPPHPPHQVGTPVACNPEIAPALEIRDLLVR